MPRPVVDNFAADNAHTRMKGAAEKTRGRQSGPAVEQAVERGRLASRSDGTSGSDSGSGSGSGSDSDSDGGGSGVFRRCTDVASNLMDALRDADVVCNDLALLRNERAPTARAAAPKAAFPAPAHTPAHAETAWLQQLSPAEAVALQVTFARVYASLAESATAFVRAWTPSKEPADPPADTHTEDAPLASPAAPCDVEIAFEKSAREGSQEWGGLWVSGAATPPRTTKPPPNSQPPNLTPAGAGRSVLFDWPEARVAAWIAQRGPGRVWTRYASVFEQRDVDGPTLMSLDLDALQHLGVALPHARVILDARQSLLSTQP
jgi:hypothetical protein